MKNTSKSFQFDALKYIPDAVIISDLKYQVLFWNQGAEKLYEIQAKDAIGQVIDQLIEVSNSPIPRTEIRTIVRKKGFWNGEAQHKPKGGQPVWVDWSISTCELDNNQPGFLAVTRDIAEKKRIEQKLRESEERHRILLEEASDPFFSFTSDGHYTYVNKAFALGVNKPVEKIVGKTIWDVFPKDEADSRFASLKEVFETGQEKVIEVRVPRDDGDRQYMTTITPVKDGTGKVFSVICSSKNITKRKQAEDALKESEKKYRLIADNMADTVSVVDLSLRFTYVSPSIMRLRGYTVEEVLDQTLEQVTTPDSLKLALDALREEMELEAGGAADPNRTRILELEEYRKDGSTIWTSNSLSFLRDDSGKPVGVLAVSSDITEKKRAQSAMAEQNKALSKLNDFYIELSTLPSKENLEELIAKRLKELAGGAATIFSEYDPEKRTVTPRCIQVDPGILEKIIKLLGKHIREVHSYVTDELYLEMTTDIVGTRRTLYEASFGSISQIASAAIHALLKINRIIGVAYLVEGKLYGTSLVAMRKEQPDPSFEIIKHFAHMAAISLQHKKAEEEKARLEAQLHQAMKMEAVGRLAGGVAHDFNNLLTGIIGYTDFLLSDVGENDPKHADLMEIKKASDRAASLTAQLLAFSRKQIIEPRVVNLNQLLANSLKMLKRLIGEDIELAFNPQKDLWNVKVDPHQIEQVLVNLAVNARDAIPGEGRLVVSTANVTIDEDFARDRLETKPGAYVLLTVSDTGCGMSNETLEHVFEPFFTTKEKGKGTGLGLSTIYGIVKQNNGLIDVHSQVGKGTTFEVYLPRVIGVAESTKAWRLDVQPKGEETILLVEDEKMVRDVTRRILEQRGFKVITVENGNQALYMVETQNIVFDLLLTDVIMPSMNGRQLYERIKAVRPNLRVLYMSGYTEDNIANHGVLDEGANFIQKPFKSQELASKIREVLDDE